MSFLDLTTNFNYNTLLNNQYNLFSNYNTFSNIFSYQTANFQNSHGNINIFAYPFNRNFNLSSNIFSYIPFYNFGYSNYFNPFNFADSNSLVPYMGSLNIDTSFGRNIFNYSNPYYDYNHFNYHTDINANSSTGNLSSDLLSITGKKNKKKTKSKTKTKTKKISTWEKIGYNAKKGVELAKNALKNAVGFTGYCAKYVKNAICKSNLGEYEYGNACDMASILRRNKNFKEIDANSVDVNNLPAGCVLVYAKGAAGYSGKYGHTEITDGNGRGISDGITNNLRKPTAIFMPVMA